jgi:hypothetical protein
MSDELEQQDEQDLPEQIAIRLEKRERLLARFAKLNRATPGASAAPGRPRTERTSP